MCAGDAGVNYYYCCYCVDDYEFGVGSSEGSGSRAADGLDDAGGVVVVARGQCVGVGRRPAPGGCVRAPTADGRAGVANAVANVGGSLPPRQLAGPPIATGAGP